MLSMVLATFVLFIVCWILNRSAQVYELLSKYFTVRPSVVTNFKNSTNAIRS